MKSRSEGVGHVDIAGDTSLTPLTERRRRRSGGVIAQRAGRSLAKHSVLVVVGVVFAFPLFWMVLTSLKPLLQAIAFPPVWWPHPVLFSNYPDALTSLPFFRFFLNTLLYAVVTIVGVLISSSLVAYGFSRIEWRGRDLLFYIMVSTLLLPYLSTLIPLFLLYKRLGWTGTYLPLMVPCFFGISVYSTFLLRQFFMTIPGDLADAARVEGANEFYIYSRIVLPLSKPALATVALFQFIYCWNDFLGPLIYLNTPSWYPLALGLNDMLGTYSTNWGWLMAASTAVTIPIVVLFLLTQRTFVQGIALTGSKG
jgi:multiple sugar transport system permease protein